MQNNKTNCKIIQLTVQEKYMIIQLALKRKDCVLGTDVATAHKIRAFSSTIM
jgi:hypothetical protein